MNRSGAANSASQTRRASAARARLRKLQETCQHETTTVQFGLAWCDRCGAQVETPDTVTRYVVCDECGKRHVAEESHEGVHGEGTIYAVVCEDGLTDYYTAERLV